MVNNVPIGVFDSGMGGISVLKDIHQLLPNESLVYFADTHFIPYGEKSSSFIVERSLKITDFLLNRSIKVLVVACNTATAIAAEALREKYPALPIIGMEPAIKPAIKETASGKVGVLATSATLNSERFAALIARYMGDVKVFSQPCPGLVECIERGDLTGDETRYLLEKYLQPLLIKGCDIIILGCTHYPFLRPLLNELLPAHVKVIDSGMAVARQVQRVLTDNTMIAPLENAPELSFYTTGDLVAFKHVFNQLWTEASGQINQVTIT